MANQVIDDKSRAANQNIVSQQAALMLNVDEIINKFNSVQGSGGYPREQFTYKNFSCIRDQQNKSTTNETHEIASLLTKNVSMQRYFYNMPPSLLSILQPTIKLYKVFYPASSLRNSAESNQKSVKGYDWRIPFDDVSIGYSGSTFSSDFVNKSLEEIMKGSGRLNGAGIKSFSYSYKGTNPAEINTNIVANLELFFASPDDLIRTINVKSDDPRFLLPKEKVVGLPEDLTFGYADLVNQSARFKTNKVSTTSDPNLLVNDHYYRIKAVVGYARPPDHYFTDLGITEEAKTDILKSISTAKVILLLTPYSHSLDFSENGSITMKIEYHASIDRILTSQDADILKIGDNYEKYREAKKAYQQQIDNRNKSIKAIKCKPNYTQKEIDSEIEKTKETLDKALESLREVNKNLYASLIKKILNFDNLRNNSGIFKVQLAPSAVGVTSGLETFTSFGSLFNVGGEALENATRERIKNIKDSRQVNSIVLLSQQAREQLAKEKVDEALNDIPNTSDNRAAADALNKKSQSANEDLNPDSDGYVNVKFIFLGDILDAALECLKFIEPATEIPRIILGNIDIEIPIVFIGGEGEDTKAETKQYTLNLSDVPISLENLYSFLIDKLIRQNRTTYPVLTFIKEIITELVVTSITPKYFGSSAKMNNSIRLSTLHLAIPLKNDNSDILTNVNGSYFKQTNNNRRLNNINVDSLNREAITDHCSQDQESLLINDVSSYFFIYCSSKFNEERNTGNEAEDVKRGIFHFRMGTDSGIIKKINFSKVDAPFYREAIASQEGKDNVSLVKQVYDAKIDMFGNNIYRPGDFVYIEPYISFIKQYRQVESTQNNVTTPQNILVDLEDKVGIGGYYQITEVQTNINENVFNTSLTAVFKAHKNISQNNNKSGCN